MYPIDFSNILSITLQNSEINKNRKLGSGVDSQ